MLGWLTETGGWVAEGGRSTRGARRTKARKEGAPLTCRGGHAYTLHGGNDPGGGVELSARGRGMLAMRGMGQCANLPHYSGPPVLPAWHEALLTVGNTCGLPGPDHAKLVRVTDLRHDGVDRRCGHRRCRVGGLGVGAVGAGAVRRGRVSSISAVPARFAQPPSSPPVSPVLPGMPGMPAGQQGVVAEWRMETSLRSARPLACCTPPPHSQMATRSRTSLKRISELGSRSSPGVAQAWGCHARTRVALEFTADRCGHG